MTNLGLPPDFDKSSWMPNPVAFNILGLDIRWYGIFFTIGFILAIGFACLKLEKWYKVSCTPFYWFVFIGIPVSLLGARLWSFVIGDASAALADSNFFAAFFNFRSGGLAIQGGVLFTVIAALIYFPLVLKKPKYHVKTQLGDQMYVKQVSMWVYADAIIPCILVGQIIGRWGNFFNQEVYGPIANFNDFEWLKTLFPAVWRGMFIDNGPAGINFHEPFFLYESFANFAIFILLYVGGEFVKFRKAGDLGIAYFILYGIVRISMEPFRDNMYQFSLSIVSSALFIALGIALLLFNHLWIAKHRDLAFSDYFAALFKLMLNKIQMVFNKNSVAMSYQPLANFKKETGHIYYYNNF